MDVTHSLVENNFSDEVEAGGDSGGSRTTGTAPSARASSPSMISTVAGNDRGTRRRDLQLVQRGACSNTTTGLIDSTIADNDGGDRGTTGGGLLDSEGTMTVQDSSSWPATS